MTCLLCTDAVARLHHILTVTWLRSGLSSSVSSRSSLSRVLSMMRSRSPTTRRMRLLNFPISHLPLIRPSGVSARIITHRCTCIEATIIQSTCMRKHRCTCIEPTILDTAVLSYTRPDSLLRLWRYISHLLTYLLTYLLIPRRLTRKTCTDIGLLRRRM